MIASATGNGSGAADETFSISIWLIPSPKYRGRIAKAIKEFSQNEAASVAFEPHVTVVGGITCPSNDYLHKTLVPSLTQAIQESTTCLDCRFNSKPHYENKWNQACVMVMEESIEFKKLVHQCRKITFGKPSTENCYPPPLGKPHLSLYYGAGSAPSPDEIASGLGIEGDSFSLTANRIAIWKTDPASVEGVAQWTELAVIDLPEPSAKL